MDAVVQTTSLQNCMMSNKDYYKPFLEDGELFVQTKDKFDTATTSQSPQELENAPDSSEAEKEEPSDSPAELEGSILFCVFNYTGRQYRLVTSGFLACHVALKNQTESYLNLFTSMPYYYITSLRTPIANTMSPLYIFSPLLCLHWVLATLHFSH